MPGRKKLKGLPVFFVLFILFFDSIAYCRYYRPPGTYSTTDDGIIIYPDTVVSGNTRTVRLQVIADNIIRVIAKPLNNLPERKSLIISGKTSAPPQWEVEHSDKKVILKTKSVIAEVNAITGSVSFSDQYGHKILAEKENAGRNFESAVYDGENLYKIFQAFESIHNDALYGMGQHQDDAFNYAGRKLTLFQNNTEVAIPFLVSNQHYGILWDNYSLTEFGDARPYAPLSDLKLFSKYNEQGWFTASYYNDKNKSGQADFEKAESDISYEYLNDSKIYLPKEFNPATGKVIWEGSIASGISGEHHFRFTYAGYIKVWVNGKLLLDRWRQAWNPGSALISLYLEKEKKCAVKIEWLPDGGESYISLKWAKPVENRNAFSFSSEAGREIDYYFIYGKDIDEVISGYRQLSGKSPVAPKWAMGLWQSRERYKTQNEILNTVSEFRKRKIPLDNIVLDWSYWKQDAWGSQEFDEDRFSDPDSMISLLHHDYHAHFMISVWPKFYEGIPAYQFFNAKNWLYKRNISNKQRDWIGNGYVSTFYDAFNSGAQKGFWDLLNKKLFTKGVDAWWMDASEPDILSNVDAQKRKRLMTPTALGTAAEFLNAYPLENAKGIYEGQRSVKPDQRVFILTRSAFAGSQKYAAALWSGDIAARWSDMKAQISAGLNFSLSGVPYWTMDIGGFAVEKKFEHPNDADLEEWREQMTRWYQFGAFCPLFRVHGQYPYREIFNTAPENHPAYQSMLFYDKLRYRLMPYIYSLAGMTYVNDYTIMRALVMDFPQDSLVCSIGDQFLFGPSLLISPIYNYRQRTRELYLPSGHGWYNFYTGQYVEGGQKIEADAPYERMPVFVKEGSIIPFGPALQYSDEKPADPITIFVYTGKDAVFDLYEDEGSNYNYEKGLFTVIHFRYNENKKKLSISKREGAFTGMLEKRTFRIVKVSKDKSVALDFGTKPLSVVQYNGQEKTISLK
ncbi:MAG TPA: TIM-barrel domain-containing protein [Puia sp.]|nr:TIM-barrel domain-containing protein [Puia sp.]